MKLFIFLIIFLSVHTAKAFQHSDIHYLFPLPNTDYHSKYSQIIIRFHSIWPYQVENLDGFIKIQGAESGVVSGETIISTDNKTIVFKPSMPFIPGEKVEVRLTPIIAGAERPLLEFTYHFFISPHSEIFHPVTDENYLVEKSELNLQRNLSKKSVYPLVKNGVSIPTDFPLVDISINNNPDTGNIFLCTYIGPRYTMILDNDGNPLWYLKSLDHRRDFKVQKDGRLTMLVNSGFGGGSHIALDSTYAIVDTFYTPEGYVIDEHELQVLPNGHYFLIVYDSRYIDMSDSVEGGHSRARVIGNSIAEMDADDNCIFFWRCWDYFDVTDAIHQDLTGGYIEFTHMNAIEIDLDGHILISSRSLDEITKIHRQTGEIIWRLGGVNNQFDWINDQFQISSQHDIRVLPNGNYTLFDNGNRHIPRFSRALELSLDTLDMTATKVWEFIDDPPSYSKYLGNVQRLPSGNTLINWAVRDSPKLTEVRPDGSKAYEMDFVEGYDCYRTFRFPWSGKASVPYLLIEPWDDKITLLFNKFGDKDVISYNIYGGLDKKPEQLIAKTTNPFLHLWNLQNNITHFFRVTAVNSEGVESGFSNEESVFVSTTGVGENVVENGDFSEGFTYWQWNVDTNIADAKWEIDSTGILQFQINDGGIDFEDVQMYYPNIRLLEEREYIFEFDAYAIDDRIIEAEIQKMTEPYTKFSRIGYTLLTKDNTHFEFRFIMDLPNELSAAIVFNAGNSNHDIFIDNVSLREVVTDIAEADDRLPNSFALQQNYPNPFNPITTINYQLPMSGDVELSIYNILGQKIATLVNERLQAGYYQVEWDAFGFASGVYYYRIESGDFIDTKKMILIH